MFQTINITKPFKCCTQYENLLFIPLVRSVPISISFSNWRFKQIICKLFNLKTVLTFNIPSLWATRSFIDETLQIKMQQSLIAQHNLRSDLQIAYIILGTRQTDKHTEHETNTQARTSHRTPHTFHSDTASAPAVCYL